MIKKIAITYPQLQSDKGTACLGQNRQFQWFASDPTYIFPVIPAYAASLLKSKGYDVLRLDAIAEEMSYEDWLKQMVDFKPDMIAMETKTPTVQMMRNIIDELKSKLPDTKIVLMGDHITAMPEESFEHSNVDFCLCGGDYDFGIWNLAEHLNGNQELESGWRYKQDGEIKNSGEKQDYTKHNLNDLPFIDRELVNRKTYAYKNGNFKYTPGTYTMVGRDCWHGKCTFCSWTTFFPGGSYRTVKPERLVEEIENMLIPLGIKEIFDDSGSFPTGKWLETFCDLMIKKGLNKKIAFSCNMRFGTLQKKDYDIMAKAGFRYILYGVESANQNTLDRVQKNLKFEVIETELQAISQANKENNGCISPHITTMIGYPWETYEDAKNTVDFAKMLFEKGLIHTLQSTIIMPYPGTPLYKEALENGWLLVEPGNRQDYDMRQVVLKSPLTEQETKNLVQSVYKSFLSPKFIFKKLAGIRSWDDVKFFGKAGKKLLNHLLDFKK